MEMWVLYTWHYRHRVLLSLASAPVLCTWSQMSCEITSPWYHILPPPLSFTEQLLYGSTSTSVLHSSSHSLLRTTYGEYIMATLRKLEFSKVSKSAQGHCPG